jgi:hypothetical protein
LALVLLVGVGAAILWGGTAAFVGEGFFGSGYEGRVIEGISILSDGEAVISSFVYHRGIPRDGRDGLPDLTLDRRPVERGERATVTGVYFHRLGLVRNQVRTTRGYAVRVLQLGENRLDLAEGFNTYNARWYAVRDGSEEGRGYVVGYDIASNLPLGYFARRGFSNSPPDPVDYFVLGELHRRATTFAWAKDGDDSTTAFVYLLDGDRLIEIDSLRHTMREVANLPGAQMLDLGLRPKRTEEGVDDGSKRDKTPTERVLVVWQGDRFSVVDPRSEAVESCPLPDEVNDAVSFSVHLISSGAVVQYNPAPNDYDSVRLLWITANGVTREETVRFSGYRRQNVRLESAKATAIVPVPLLLGTIAVLAAGDSPAHQGKSSAEAVADMLAAAWPPFVMLFFVSAALAWWVWTAHCRDGRPYAALCAGLVFLLGPAAWVGYVAERPRTPAATCPACGKRSPRNRVVCASCGDEAFRPRMVGTEVFA